MKNEMWMLLNGKYDIVKEWNSAVELLETKYGVIKCSNEGKNSYINRVAETLDICIHCMNYNKFSTYGYNKWKNHLNIIVTEHGILEVITRKPREKGHIKLKQIQNDWRVIKYDPVNYTDFIPENYVIVAYRHLYSSSETGYFHDELFNDTYYGYDLYNLTAGPDKSLKKDIEKKIKENTGITKIKKITILFDNENDATKYYNEKISQ